MKKQNIFSSIVIMILFIIFAAVYTFSIQETWEIPNNISWAVNFMLYYLLFICLRTVILLSLSFYESVSSARLPKLEYPPLVTIIIPCFNEEKVIEESIDSARKINYPNLEILIIDDGSTDQTFEKAITMANNIDHRVRVISKPNGGKANALNTGLSEATGDFVLCMDADSALHPDALNESIPYFNGHPRLGALAGTVAIGNGKTILTRFQCLEYVIGLNFHKKAQSALNIVTIVPGPVGLFRKKVVQEVGGFDETTYAEDCDLTLKILMAGYDIRYSPKMIAVTEAPDSFYDLSIQRYRWTRGTIQAILKNIDAVFNDNGFNFRNFIILLYMIIETLIIPSINFLFAMFTITVAIYYKKVYIYGPFFLGLIAMDLSITIYSIIFERQLISFLFLSLINRVTFGFSLEIMRFYSMIDEILKIPMKWGTITRRGNR